MLIETRCPDFELLHDVSGHTPVNEHDIEGGLQEREYLMTKTAAMHFGQGRDLHGHQGGAGMGVIPPGREVKPHQCQQCLKAFSSNHQLVQHIRVHTGEKPYKCSYCPRRFKQLSHVQQHTRLHTGERPYKCHVIDCGRAFIQLSNLQQHLRNHESQLERLKNRPFHCNVCGKGFATESSLRTHTGKADCRCPTWGVGNRHGRGQASGELEQCSKIPQHSTIGGSNPSCCPICQKVCLSGEELMEHMKYVHKDPNASGVPAKRRAANHPCPVCGKFYVNEGSLRKHLACHPEMASQLSSSLRMWPCNVCTAVFTHENGLLAHMDQMRMDPKHQFAAQYVLSRAANERREREALLAAAAMNMSHLAMSANVQPLLQQVGSPSGQSESPTRISTPAEHKLERGGVRSPLGHAGQQHQVQQQQQVQLQSHHQQQIMDYGLGRMSSNAMLGMSSSGQLVSNNLGLENGAARESLRLGSPNNNNNNTDQLLSPNALQTVTAPSQASSEVGSAMNINSSGTLKDDQSNETGYPTLRSDTDISPVNESSNKDSSHHQLNEHTAPLVTSSSNQPTSFSDIYPNYPVAYSEASYTAASEILNRYRLEQTIKQLQGHGF